MNIVIIGGLFAIALLAVLALVFLVRGEPRTSKKNVTKVDNEPLKLSETAQVAASGTPTLPGLPTTEAETEVMPELHNVQQFPVGNGQFHRLSVELHSLHGQAQEIENRLGVLTEMIEGIENDQGHYTHVEEDASMPAEPASAN